MRLPNLSNSMGVARLRYIQSIHETAGWRNPDAAVRFFMPMTVRWQSAWLGRKELARLRAQPFYYYLIARTKYYDGVFTDAIAEGARQIVNIGCGSDTRAFRFSDSLNRADVRVLECDQPVAVDIKRELAKRWTRVIRPDYLPLELNADAWPDLDRELGPDPAPPTLVLMEGVSPYIDETAFGHFLAFLARRLSPGSSLAYDFKVRGADDEFGRGGRTRTPFRLPAVRAAVAAYHDRHGFALEHFEVGSDLCSRMLPPSGVAAPSYGDDALVRLRVRGPRE